MKSCSTTSGRKDVSSDWVPFLKQPEIFIPYDLEKYPLRLKTDSEIGSNHHIDVIMYSDTATSWQGYTDLGYVWIRFTEPMTYKIGSCTHDHVVFETQPVLRAKLEDFWRITKTSTNLIVECNGVVVLDLSFAASPMGECKAKWSQEVVKIAFWSGSDGDDDATIAYYRRPGKEASFCLGSINFTR